MTTPAPLNPDKHHRLPGEIRSPAVWLCSRFCPSHRDGAELLCGRGVGMPDDAIRQWCRKVGRQYANQWRRRRPQPGDTGSDIDARVHPLA
jgi:transposase-like protein